MPITFKGIGDNYGRLHAQFARTGGGVLYSRVTGFYTIKRKIKKMGSSYCYF